MNVRLDGSNEGLPGKAYLVSWALAGSLWPPNASLLFCQKEVLMLCEKEETICYTHILL